MRTIHRFKFYEFFGGRWPMFTGQGRLTWDEFEREDGRGALRYFVIFEPEGFDDTMARSFRSQAELLLYMRRWGLGTTDIRVIYEHDWEFRQMVPTWCVLAHDPFYGTLSSKEGYRRRFYFPTEEAAERGAAQLGSNWHVDDIYPTQRLIQFKVPYGNTVRVPFNTR